MVTSLYFYPAILSATIFTVYIGTGHILELSAAYSIITVLNILTEPLRAMPLFLGQLIEFRIAMQRI